MQKILLVAWREFRQRVRSRGFIVGSLAVPVIMIVVSAFTGTIEVGAPNEPSGNLDLPTYQGDFYGCVDQADLIRQIPENLGSVNLRAYPGEAQAAAALRDGQIEAYYVIPADYRQSGAIRLVSLSLPAFPQDNRQFDWILVANLLPDHSIEQTVKLYRPFDGIEPEFVNLELSPDELGRQEPGAPTFSMLPFLVTIAVIIPLFTSGSYLLQSVTAEKSSRIMEILLVSLRPRHILAGKLAGLGGLTLVQYLIWGGIAGLGLLISSQDLTAFLAPINLTATEILLVLPFALGGFVLYASIMAGIGALAPDLEGSRSWVFVITLPMMVPIYLWTAIVENPNGPVALALSIIPFSAPVAMLMRMTSAAVPAWQLVTSLALVLLSGVGMLWLMGRLFRVQTLLSGESISLKRLLAALRG